MALPSATSTPPTSGGSNKAILVIGGIAIVVILALVFVFFGLPFINGLSGGAAPEPTSSVSSGRPTATPMSVEDQVKATVEAQNAAATANAPEPTERPANPTATLRPTNTPLPTATARPVNTQAPTATPQPADPVDSLSISEQAKAILRLNFATATPGPGTGPEKPKDESPVMSYPLPTDWKYGHLAHFMNEVNDGKLDLGYGPLTTYEVADKVLVWFLVEEQHIGNRFSVTDQDGNSWYNCNLEDQGGCKVDAQDEILVVNDFGRSDVVSDGAVCRPFAEGSTDGGWGLWLCSGEFSTVQGYIYMGADDNAKVEQGADLK